MESLEKQGEKKFWCFICKKEINIKDINDQITCSICDSEFVEEIENETDKEEQKRFNPLVNQNQNSISQVNINNLGMPNISFRIISSNQGNLQTFTQNLTGANFPNHLQNIISQVNNLFSFSPSTRITIQNFGNSGLSQFLNRHNNDQSFENLLNYLMMNDPNRHGTPPASKKILSSLPRVKISEGNFENYNKSDCLVCMDSYQDGEIVIKLKCQHIFHDNCIIDWLKLHNSCPVCRYEMETDDEDYENKKNERRRVLREYNQSSNI